MLRIIIISTFLISCNVIAAVLTDVNGIDDKEGLFSGRVSKVNRETGIVRLRVDFSNVKFLNKANRIEIWLDHNFKKRCRAKVLGKTNRYLLAQIIERKNCYVSVPFAVGSYVMMYSHHLSENIDLVKELITILLKKKLAINSKIGKVKDKVATYVDKVESVNKRYDIIAQKLENQRQKDLVILEQDRINLVRKQTDLEVRLSDVNFKLEKYQYEDENLRVDRWSLDESLYRKR